MGEHINTLPLDMLTQMRDQVVVACAVGIEDVQLDELTTPSGEVIGISADCDDMLEALEAQIATRAAVTSPTGANE